MNKINEELWETEELSASERLARIESELGAANLRGSELVIDMSEPAQ